MQKTLDIGIRKQILAFGLCISVDMGKKLLEWRGVFCCICAD